MNSILGGIEMKIKWLIVMNVIGLLDSQKFYITKKRVNRAPYQRVFAWI